MIVIVHVSFSLKSELLKRAIQGTTWGVLSGLLRGMLGVWTIAHVTMMVHIVPLAEDDAGCGSF